MWSSAGGASKRYWLPAHPLPPLEEMMIEDLTEEEARAFYEAIDNL